MRDSSVAASAGVARARQRTTLLKAGLLTGGVWAAAGIFLAMASGGSLTPPDLLAHIAFSVAAGLAMRRMGDK